MKKDYSQSWIYKRPLPLSFMKGGTLMGKFPKIGEFTDEELTSWLNTLDIFHSTAIIEKLYKDMRDFAIAHDQEGHNEKP